jgi:hypothetical protein
MDEMWKELNTAPREAEPGRDLWPGIESKMHGGIERRWQRAAAAILVFGAGVLGGIVVERSRLPVATLPVEESAIHRVAMLQRAGSDYVAAVARLRDLGPEDESLRAQGYEVALGVVSVTAQEVTAALDLNDDDTLVDRARAVHAAASERATELLKDGGE